MGLIHCGFGVFLFLTHNTWMFLKLGLLYIYILLMFFRSILCLHPCCFCKLLGFLVGFMVCTMLYAASMFSLNQYFYLNVMHFLVKYCHSCALVGLFLDAYT